MPSLFVPLFLLATLPALAYDPLAVPPGASVQAVDMAVIDRARQREIPLRVYLPARREPAPIVLFSHGLGGSREGSAFLGRHWAGRGYAAVFLQHPGSDAGVWQGRASGERTSALHRAANGRNLMLRVQDVSAVLDELTRWNADARHPFHGRLDLSRVGMSGHSFGAVTAQAVSGQRFRNERLPVGEPRIRAAVMMSPSSPRRGDAEQAFAGVTTPWLLMTGTHDEAKIGGVDVASRLAVYPALPPGGKYELVLDGAEHSAFTDRALPGDRAPRNPNHHRAILATSTAFWDAWLQEDRAARDWLDGQGPRTVLESSDRWQRK